MFPVYQRMATAGAVLSLILVAAGMPSAVATSRDLQWRTGGDPRACSAPTWGKDMPAAGPGNGRRVVVIGDSLTRESRSSLEKLLRTSGWNPTVRCFGGKRLDWAQAQVREQRKWKGLPSTVIIAIGTNDMRWISRDVTLARIKSLLHQLGADRQVLWVNTFGGNGEQFSKSKQRWFNDTLARLAATRPHLTVVPWDQIARREKIRLSSPIHYTKPGYQLRSEATVNALNSAYGRVPPPPAALVDGELTATRRIQSAA